MWWFLDNNLPRSFSTFSTIGFLPILRRLHPRQESPNTRLGKEGLANKSTNTSGPFHGARRCPGRPTVKPPEGYTVRDLSCSSFLLASLLTYVKSHPG